VGLVPKGLNLWFHCRNMAVPLGAKQYAKHPRDGETGLSRKLPAFLFINNYDVSLQIACQNDGFRFTLMKR